MSFNVHTNVLKKEPQTTRHLHIHQYLNLTRIPAAKL
jgi:hypothetical protein